MKKTGKIIVCVLAVLLLVTAVLAVVHVRTRDAVPEGALLVEYAGEAHYVDAASLPLTAVSGTLVNGKGEEKSIETSGAALIDVLREAGLDPDAVVSVTVTADDEFAASLSGEEVREAGRAFLAPEEDGSLRLIVFGDANSKRQVKNVVKIAAEG